MGLSFETGEGVSVTRVLLVFLAIAPFYAAIAWYVIGRKLRASARNDGQTLIAKWAISYVIVVLMFTAAAYAGGGFALIGVVFVVLLPGSIILAIILAPYIANLITSPITNAMEGSEGEHWEKPAYGPAITSRNRGDYKGALERVEELLEIHPGDFEGLMMKASIQAEDFGDLGEARVTLNEILSEKKGLKYNLPVVYNKLADWQMNLFDDPEGARHSLEVIRNAYPESKAAQLAEQRISSMDSYDETSSAATDIDETYQRLAAQSAINDQLKGPLEIPAASEEDSVIANEMAFAQCINRVEEHPDSIVNREEFAALYVNHTNEPDLAVQQYEYLVAMPGASEKQQVAWLNKITDIQVKSGATQEEAKATLQRVIDINPDGAGATRAQSRMMHLAIEIRAANKKNTPLNLERRDEDLGLM